MRKIQLSVLQSISAGLVLACCAVAMANPRTVNDGVYTEEQADVGEQLYADNCLICHDKKYFRPVLTRSEGQPLSIMFAVMSTSMPESNPGFMSKKEYADILAYILSLSRYAAGDNELDYENGALDKITIEARKRN
jgi:mono/diheme cytochrome c family protein